MAQGEEVPSSKGAFDVHEREFVGPKLGDPRGGDGEQCVVSSTGANLEHAHAVGDVERLEHADHEVGLGGAGHRGLRAPVGEVRHLGHQRCP